MIKAMTEEEIKILCRLFQHPAGKEAKELLEKKYIAVNSFDNDPYVNAYNSGIRGLALILCACANVTVEVVGTEQVEEHDTDNTTG